MLKFQPITCTIQIKSIIDIYERLYFTKVTKFYLLPKCYTLSLVNCNTKLMQHHAKELVSTYTAVVNLDLFSVN